MGMLIYSLIIALCYAKAIDDTQRTESPTWKDKLKQNNEKFKAKMRKYGTQAGQGFKQLGKDAKNYAVETGKRVKDDFGKFGEDFKEGYNDVRNRLSRRNSDES